MLTPDSSRFWPADTWRIGISPPCFDKQFVRDYLETLDWNKRAPGPRLPREVIERTAEKYREALRRLTGPSRCAHRRHPRHRAPPAASAGPGCAACPTGCCSVPTRRGARRWRLPARAGALSLCAAARSCRRQADSACHGLVYASLLAIIPLLAFSFGILKAFHAQGVLEPLVHEFFGPMGSAADEFTARVDGVCQ